mgnify:CR=1 FL=1
MDRIQKYGPVLPGRWTHFWDLAFGPNGRQARLCVALRQHLQYSILSTGTFMNKRAQFLIVKIGSHKVGLMNLYARNSAEGMFMVVSFRICGFSILLVGGR